MLAAAERRGAGADVRHVVFLVFRPNMSVMGAALAESRGIEATADLVTTGEAAALLGVSRQHVVDLCQSGNLPFFSVGTHRRIRRIDVEDLRDSAVRLTRDQVRSLLLAYAVAGHLVTDPEGTIARARQNLARMRASSPRGAASVWLDQWEVLLGGPLIDLLQALTSPSMRSRELRQNTPFAGVLSEKERLAVLATASSVSR